MRSRLWIPEIPPFYINTRKTVEGELTSPSIMLSGHYDFYKRNSYGQEWKVGSTSNLITDVGMDLIGSSTDGFLIGHQMILGTGASAPDVADTTLSSFLYGQIANSYHTGSLASGSGYFYTTHRVGTLFDYANANGVITEVGMRKSSGNLLFSRALIKDNDGIPSNITKTSDEQLIVYYTLRRDIYTGSMSGIVNLDGIDYDYDIMAQNFSAMTASDYSFDANTSPTVNWELRSTARTYRAHEYVQLPENLMHRSSISGSSYTFPNPDLQSYTNGTHYRDLLLSIDPTNGNLTHGIGGIDRNRFGMSGEPAGEFNMTFTPNIPKTNVQRLQLYLRTSWARGPVYDRFPNTPSYP